jgi:hypothetical protein
MDEELNSTELQITSPVLIALKPEKLPNPLPVCAACPAAVWHVSEQALRCYCRIMHLESWTSEQPQPLLACDGQVIATQEAEAKQADE